MGGNVGGVGSRDVVRAALAVEYLAIPALRTTYYYSLGHLHTLRTYALSLTTEQGLLSAKSHKLFEQRQDAERAELKALRKATNPGAKARAADPYSA